MNEMKLDFQQTLTAQSFKICALIPYRYVKIVENTDHQQWLDSSAQNFPHLYSTLFSEI